MKIFTLAFLLISNLNIYAQVINDDCTNAIDLGMIGQSQDTEDCFDGSNSNDTVLYTSNANSLPDYPYYGMTGCIGYTDSTGPANDIWYKFKSSSFQMNVAPTNGIDTLHLNVWQGTDCSNLTPSGCQTFDFTNFAYNPSFSGSPTNDYVYLQFSGNKIGKFMDFVFCLKVSSGATVPAYGTSVITAPTSFKNYSQKKEANIFPNPANDYITIENTEAELLEISDIKGQLLEQVFLIKNLNQIIRLDHLTPGMFFFTLKSGNTLLDVRKVVKN